jgi:hypothetical protein
MTYSFHILISCSQYIPMTTCPSNQSAIPWIGCCSGPLYGYPVARRKVSVFHCHSSGCYLIVSISSTCNHSTWVNIINIIIISSTRHHWCKSVLSTDKAVKGVSLVKFETYGTDLCACEFLYFLEAVEFSELYTIVA